MHPALKIIYLIVFALLEQRTSVSELLGCSIVLAIGVQLYKANNFYKLCLRMRWLFLVMMLIYAYGTPGEYMQGLPVDYAPSYDGLLAGLMQVLKVVNLLAVISLILYTTTREHLIAGIILIMQPLVYVGVNTKRFAARLYLTLYYAGVTEFASQSLSFFDYVLQSLNSENHVDEKLQSIEINVPSFRVIDVLLLVLLVFVVFYRL